MYQKMDKYEVYGCPPEPPDGHRAVSVFLRDRSLFVHGGRVILKGMLAAFAIITAGRLLREEMMSESIYGEHLPKMEALKDWLIEKITEMRRRERQLRGEDPVEHCLSRIKGEESMREKCRRKNLPETAESALTEIRDGIGIRIVCAFLSDVFYFVEELKALPGGEVIEEKDYITNAKKNGYRSYHMIMRFHGKYFVEFQVRTISMDVWAALEHQIKYKKNLDGNLDLITSELKRCADEPASTDLSMQTLRDMIQGE